MTRFVHALLPALVVCLSAAFAAAPEAAAEDHLVRKGETLGGIARKYHCTLSALKSANGLKKDGIRAGQTLAIPDTCGSGSADGAGQSGQAGNAGDPAPQAGQKGQKPRTITHEVLADETLEGLAARYGTTVEAITTKNKAALKKGMRPGIKLKIVTSADEHAQKRFAYSIQAGDTLTRIAKRFGLTVKDLQRMNPGKDPDRLRIGDKLYIYGEGRPGKSQSVGRPQAGKLVDGEQLTEGPAWTLRTPAHSWGTNETIRMLKQAFLDVRKKHPKIHRICIGDISAKNGGFLAPHKSHQSGLDADIGYYFKRTPGESPCVFNNASVGLDLEAMWTLINELAGPSPEASKIAYMFLGYDVQKQIYDWAKEHGASDSKLEWLFQYPRGSRAMRGLIRHEPSHQNHIHVRFECPNGDDDCVSTGGD